MRGWPEPPGEGVPLLLETRIPDVVECLLALVLAGCLSWMLVPWTESLAWRLGAIDRPKERSLHVEPTPKLGGVAVLAAILLSGWLFLPWEHETRAILAGAALIALVGVVDDVVELPPGAKLAGQIAAAIIPVTAGVTVQDFTLPFIGRVDPASVVLVDLPLGGTFDLGDAMTIFGVVLLANLINFSDGVDGLAAGVCVISSACLAVIALSLDRNVAGALALITTGAALGFLRHGFPPASSFMGDTGSNLLGYMLAIVTIQGSLKTNAVLALALPLVALAVPILDGSFVIAKRVKYGRPIYRGDTSHFHHRLANIGFSPRETLLYLYGWTFVLAGLALALRFIPYSDDRGHFDVFWSIVMGLLLVLAFAASVYVVAALEILKLRRSRLRERFGRRGTSKATREQVDEGVAKELETGSFPKRPV